MSRIVLDSDPDDGRNRCKADGGAATGASRAVAVRGDDMHGADGERAGARGDVDDLVPVVYQELRRIAGGMLRNALGTPTLQPTALVHEAYLRLARDDDRRWNDRTHFTAVAATAMRQILGDYARRHLTDKRGGGWHQVALFEDRAVEANVDVDLIALDEALTTLANGNSRQARIVELRFLAGMRHEDVARVLDISVETVKRDWRFARAWLMAELSRGDAP